MQPTRSWLTVDQGNTSLDAVCFEVREETLDVVKTWRGLTIVELSKLKVGMRGDAPRVAVSSVLGSSKRRALMEQLARTWPGAKIPSSGLELIVETPETTGVDRLFAARAASSLARTEAAIVVDVGTAMTVDLVEGVSFMGGAIAPGPGLLAKALGEGGAELFEVGLAPRAKALGKSTREALEAGVVVGLRGAARELALEIGAEASSTADVFVTGGARELLLSPKPFLGKTDLFEVPLLVHLGLLFASGFEGRVPSNLIQMHGSASR